MRKEDEEFARRVWAGTKIETCRSYLKEEDLFRKMTRTEYVKYVKPALFDMATRSAKQAIAQWGGDVKTITHIVFGTMTGSIHAPTMDTQIALDLGLQTNIKRLNIEGMGCLTGYRCLGLASDIARADPANIVLTVVCDIRSALGNQLSKHEDLSPIDKSNVIVSSLFRDSGASAIVTSAALATTPASADKKPLYEILEHRSMLVPDSFDLVKYAERDDAVIHLYIDKELPAAIAKVLGKEVEAMIQPYGLKGDDCSYSVHTGGPKVLNYVSEALKVNQERLASSWYCMKKYGNLSGSSNLVVLDHWRKLASIDASIKQDAREFVVCISFGPGVGMELVLLRAVGVPFNQ
jgi:alkylresorcinol/alkylpyrone synthase